MILVSLTTGYIVSYITYLLSAHIPNYKRETRNERLLRESYLWRYKTDLVECFSLLVHLHSTKIAKISQIEEIKDFFLKSNRKWFYHEYLINEAKQSKGQSIISHLEKLINSSKTLLSMSQVYDCKLSFQIANAIKPEWVDLIQIIQADITGKYNSLSILEKQYNLVKQNFDLGKEV